MFFKTVESIDELPIEANHYALGLFASGFENRSTHVASISDRRIFTRVAVVGFSDGIDVLSREANDDFFSERFGVNVDILSGVDDDQYYFGVLEDAALRSAGSVLRILVDYSVMTRAWYGAILTWARFSVHANRVEIDFIYSCGRYLAEFDPLSISEIQSLPGFEGVSGGFRHTTAIFGLGYDKYATLAVYDRLEPDTMYCCIARRTIQDANAAKVLTENELIVESAARVVELPLTNVAEAFRLLCDHILSLDRNTHLVIVPMGPKSHVLVTMLVALRLPWVTCLHAKGVRLNPVQVEALGPISIARVCFEVDGSASR